jgi:5-methylthioadenosine/S-adenosylhomocysteine deaminase
MFLGDGITRLTDMLRAGVRVGLGTDGGCSNDRLCLYDEMRAAAQLQKVRHLDGGALGARRVFAMGTAEGADILGVRAGRLEAGRHADIVLLERDHPSLLPRTSDVLSHIVYAMSHRAIREVIVAGRTVARDGAPMRVTAHAIAERVKAVTGDWEAAAE